MATASTAASALPRLLKVAEVAEALGLTRANLYAHVERGNFRFKPVKLGKALRFRERDVIAFINGESAVAS